MMSRFPNISGPSYLEREAESSLLSDDCSSWPGSWHRLRV
jgi:hypothetical protein